jgi:hypothetical protein
MDYALTELGRVCIATKDYIWRQNDKGPMMSFRKKEVAPCSLIGVDIASFKLDQNPFQHGPFL